MASASTWPLSRQTALDLNGDVVPGARLQFFKAGTTTPLTVFSDPALSVELPAYPDAIETDANGRWPRIYLPYEDYRERITTPDETLLSDDDGIANPAPPTVDTTVPISQRVQTGTVITSLGPLDGYVALNGQSIGNAESGATARANADTLSLFTYIYDNVANASAPVSGGRGANAATDYAAGKTLTLPNFQGRALTGLIGMGGTASTILDAVTFTTGTKTDVAAQAGAATHTLTTAQMPAHNHAGSTADVNGAHTHTYDDYNQDGATGSGSFSRGTVNANAKTTSGDGAHGHNLTIVSNGSGNAHPNMQPTALVYVLVKL